MLGRRPAPAIDLTAGVVVARRAALLAAAAALAAGGLGVGPLASPSTARAASDYPPEDSAYHSYAEMADLLHRLARERPDIVRVFSLGQSARGREIWAAEVSDDVGREEAEPEPEVLFDGLHHAREHLSAELPIALLKLLVGRYGDDTTLGRRVTRLVDSRRIWIVPMVNPDGLVYDLSGGPYGGGHYRGWRKNRQPNPGSDAVGTDVNRNYGYRFGCCGASSGNPTSDYYRGPAAWSAPEARVVRDFVLGRVTDGRQRIRTHVTFHTAGEMVLWPYGHTRADVPPDMTLLDQRALVAMGRAMAASNGYRAMQSSELYPTDGDQIDWMYGRQRIFSFTFELYPASGAAGMDRYYPPDERIDREARRNRGAMLYLIARADCPYEALGADARAAWCGPFFDDLEIDRGWATDPEASDTATAGPWVRGVARADGVQPAEAVSGQGVLVTGRLPGVDVDGGATTVRSPRIAIPGSGGATLRLSHWVALGADAGTDDGFRVHLVDGAGGRVASLLEVSGDGTARAGEWRRLAAAIPAGLAGQEVAIELEAVDVGGDSLVEVAVDQVRVTAP